MEMEAKKKILIIDDEPEIRELAESRLRANHYDVITATDGEDGLLKLETENPNLILVDISMPRMDGWTFVRRVKKDDALKHIPIIVFTSHKDMKDLFEVEGISEYLVKPYDASELLSKIQKHIL